MGFLPARISGTVLLPPDVWSLPAALTPLGATVLHGGFLHLFFNMAMLIVAGRALEPMIGTRGLVLLYLVGAYASAGAEWAWGPLSEVPMIGASGAVSALLGGYSLLFGRSRARAIGPIPERWVHALWLAAAWTGINLLAAPVFAMGGMPIAAAAHIGGFVVGLVLVRPLLEWRWRGA